MDAAPLTALAEPTRVRIVELLAGRPHAVGEIAATLDLRQPQVTKHLQTLQRAGLITVHPLGQRRICALERTRFAELRDWLDGLAGDASSSDAALETYRRAVDAETAAAAGRPGVGRGARPGDRAGPRHDAAGALAVLDHRWSSCAPGGRRSTSRSPRATSIPAPAGR